MLRPEPFEKQNRMRRIGQGCNLIAHAFGRPAIAWIGQHRRYRRTHGFRRSRHSVERQPNTQGGAAGRVQRLIGPHGHQNHRQAVRQRANNAARATMRDDHSALRQDHRLGNLALDPDVGRLRTELGRIYLVSHGGDDIDR